MAVVMTLLGAAGACVADDPPTPPTPPQPERLDWAEIRLPEAPAGERVMLRAAAVCGGRWYLTGAYGRPDGATRPAAWTSRDGSAWASMTLAPESYYGRRSVLYTAACRDGRLATVGGKPGGAHGNPRVSSWQLVPGAGGAGEILTEIPARFELYGGPAAVNVARLVAGPPGWLITGNRSSGAAVWLSPDASAFEIVEAAPVLSNSPGLFTWASHAVAYGDGWTVVGGLIRAGRIDRDPVAWTSTDGLAWRQWPVPAGSEYDEITLVTRHGEDLVAIGPNGGAYQAWRAGGTQWRAAGRFGSTQPAAATGVRVSAASAGALASAGGLVVAAVGDGVANSLWVSRDGGESWRALASPVDLPAGVDSGVALIGIPAGSGQPERVLMATDDGRSGRAFLAAAQ